MKVYCLQNKFSIRFFLPVFLLLFAIICLPHPVLAVTYFTDNMEGTSNWTADSPWAITSATGAYHSATKAWTDSPGGYYANNANTSLTMASPVNLVSAATPQLVFWHKYQLEALESPYGDHGYVEITTDGTTWTQIASFTGISDWKREQIDLTPYAGQTNVKIRFRLVTDKTVVMDGWYIDDVTIAELPHAVANLTTGTATANSLALSWTQNLDADFASYKIYRSTAPGVTTDSTLVTSITTQTTTTYTNSSLTPGTTYYYKVYVANTNDLYAASKDASGTTIASGYSFPFFDNMENGSGGWTAQSPWAIDAGTDHTGATGHFWSDSPGGASYATNANYALSIKVNLAGAIRPVLKFWQQYAYELNRDYGFVEVSLDNTNWTPIYSVTGSAQWEEAVIDLTRWASQTIYLRFRTDSDGQTNYGGWEIDDVSINEATTNAAWTGNTPYPFTDGFDSETSFKNNWITTNKGKEFVWSSSDGHTTSGTAYLYPPQNIPVETGHYLVLAKPIDLTPSVNPQLSFWHKYRVYYYNHIYVYVSVDGGKNWIEKSHWNYATQAAWTKVQIDLTEYKTSKNVLIMLSYWGGDDYDDAYWYVDDLQITEGPTAVTPSTPVLTPGNTQHSVTLSWATPSNPDFAQYEIYRSTTAGVTLSSTLIKTITDVSANTYTDPDLGVPGQVYYYRMWVKDTKGLYSSGSTEVSATTVQYLTTVTFPFFDNMESGGNNWSGVSPWAIDAGTDHTGATGHFW
ncbi:MAG: fibronectin type III domain-containing protein, partial [Deltaproteobacteria bacterium]